MSPSFCRTATSSQAAPLPLGPAHAAFGAGRAYSLAALIAASAAFALSSGALALAGGAALAQPSQVAPVAAGDGPAEAAPAAPVLTPPVLKNDPGAVYPAAALSAKVAVAVTVQLAIAISVSGEVTQATVLTPQGNGFDEAAVESAMKLAFDPAQRAGKPIPSKIRYSITFPVQNARVLGRVVQGASGAPLAGAKVAIVGADGLGYESTTLPDGTFRVDVVAPGKYTVRATADGYEVSAREEAIDPATENKFALRLTAVTTIVITPEPGKPPPRVSVDIEDVDVRGVRPPREVTRRTFDQRELSRIPGTNGDALRAIQNFPGVARPPGLAGLLIVRGSGPQDTNVFVDGTLIPLVYHFGGLSSVIPTEMLEKIDFYPGNFSSQYGRVTGGVVDVGLRAPKSDKFHGLAQVDLIDLRLLAEGPLGKGWSFAAAGRRSYFDLYLGPVLQGLNAGVTTAPKYYDYQFVLNKEWSKNESLRLAFFGSDDGLSILSRTAGGTEPGLSGSINFSTAFYRLQAKYRKRFNDSTELRVIAAAGRDSLAIGIGSNFLKLDSAPTTLRAELSHKLAPGVTTTMGIDWLWSPFDISVRLPPLPRPGEPPPGPFTTRPQLTVRDTDTIYRPGLYNEFELTPWRGGRIVAGMRVDYSKDTKRWDLSPRLVARQDLTREFPRTTLKGGLGLFRQPPQPQETNLIFGQTGLSSNRAVHYTAGAEQEITRQLEVSVEGYYRDLDNLVVPGLGNRGVGRAFGLETLIRYKPDAKFFGFLAYTLSRSTRRDSPNEPERFFAFDQTHILTALGSYRLGRGWELGARFRLISGSLQPPRERGFFDGNAGVYLPAQFQFNQERLPMFHQLDIRVDKTWKFDGFQIAAYLDLLNSYNSPNVEGVSYNFDSTQRTYGGSLPFLPSLGLRGEL